MKDESKLVKELARDLPSILPNEPDTNNYELMRVYGESFADTYDDLESVSNALTVQNAETIEQLHELGKLVDVHPREGEKVEKYRSRVIAGYQLATSEGAISDILTSVAVVLGADEREIQYQRFNKPKTIGVAVPGDKLKESGLTNEDIAEAINNLTSVGVTVEPQVRGTLEFVSPETYHAIENGNDNWDNYPGYDGLDSDGNRKYSTDAGTFAGTLE